MDQDFSGLVDEVKIYDRALSASEIQAIFNSTPPDTDADGFDDNIDNCPLTTNADQTDTDGDGGGDACDSDDDGDGFTDGEDGCPLVSGTDGRCPVASVEALVGGVISLVESFNLAQGIANSLDSKLQNALDALDAATAGDRQSACNQLAAFMNNVEAQSGKQLTGAQAGQLLADAGQIQAVLGCP